MQAAVELGRRRSMICMIICHDFDLKGRRGKGGFAVLGGYFYFYQFFLMLYYGRWAFENPSLPFSLVGLSCNSISRECVICQMYVRDFLCECFSATSNLLCMFMFCSVNDGLVPFRSSIPLFSWDLDLKKRSFFLWNLGKTRKGFMIVGLIYGQCEKC